MKDMSNQSFIMNESLERDDLKCNIRHINEFFEKIIPNMWNFLNGMRGMRDAANEMGKILSSFASHNNCLSEVFINNITQLSNCLFVYSDHVDSKIKRIHHNNQSLKKKSKSGSRSKLTKDYKYLKELTNDKFQTMKKFLNEFGLILSTFHCTGEELTALALKCVSDENITQNVSKQLMNINKNLYAKKMEYSAKETPKVSGLGRHETNLPTCSKTTDIIRPPLPHYLSSTERLRHERSEIGQQNPDKILRSSKSVSKILESSIPHFQRSLSQVINQNRQSPSSSQRQKSPAPLQHQNSISQHETSPQKNPYFKRSLSQTTPNRQSLVDSQFQQVPLVSKYQQTSVVSQNKPKSSVASTFQVPLISKYQQTSAVSQHEPKVPLKNNFKLPIVPSNHESKAVVANHVRDEKYKYFKSFMGDKLDNLDEIVKFKYFTEYERHERKNRILMEEIGSNHLFSNIKKKLN